jgi:hypothetical protein
MNLLDATRSLLDWATEAGVSLREIAPPDGPVEYEWLKKFRQGGTEHPSVTRIQTLHDRLKSLKRSADRKRA